MSEQDRVSDFHQDGPELTNTWQADAFLQACLQRLLSTGTFDGIAQGLDDLGQRAAREMPELARAVEQNPPVHVPFDPWGRRIDEIRVADEWQQLHRIAAEEGIVATAYERKEGSDSRLHQFARLYLYHPSSAIYSCPLAMTDGAARIIEQHGDARMKERALAALTSRDPDNFWTSGQWMTERAGGSDVSGTATVARPQGDTYRLFGTKWFTSATTSPMAFTLARIEEDDTPSEKLSLFYLELRDEQGDLDNIEVHRLKDKLGTKALPTAELTLDGTRAQLVGEAGRGVATIATLLNITRLYNACCAASQMRRAVMLATDYAHKREAFGRRLIDHALHADTLESLEAETRVATLLVLHAARLLGREETDEATGAERKLLRLLTPMIKLYTAKQSIATCSEALECFGGAGYVEDTGLPWLLRDAQVFSIWEGTTNVLSLDMLRAAGKDDSLPLFMEDMRGRLKSVDAEALQGPCGLIEQWLGDLGAMVSRDPESNARRMAYRAARILGATLLVEHAAWSRKPEDIELLQRWMEAPLVGK